MRHLFQITASRLWLVPLLLPAWLASGCEDGSIRLGGWIQTGAQPAPGPMPAAPQPPPFPPPPPPSPPFPGPVVFPPPTSGPGGSEAGDRPLRPAEMPEPVYQLLVNRCFTCHQYGQRDPAGWGSVLEVSRLIDAQIVVPGDLESSRMWFRVAVRRDMPFNGARLTPDELGIIQNWIVSLQRPAPQPRTQAQILDRLVQDMATSAGGGDTRYISFAEFVDGRRPPEEIKTAQGVFKVALNSVSRAATLVNPVALDPEGSIWRFRLSELGWDEQDWNTLVSFYPYCQRSEQAQHQALYQRLRTEAPIVRADWFVSAALSPALYHRLLKLGTRLDQTVRLNLGVDIAANIAMGNVQRIAAALLGVAVGGAVFERHQSSGGGYLWLTYHIDDGSDVRSTPLGPKDENNPLPRRFSSVTTSALWSLPNGLQAYFLADDLGGRINQAPTRITQDPRNRVDGSMQNAVSCNNCHGSVGLTRPQAPIPLSELLQPRQPFPPEEVAEIERLYPANAVQILAADAARYQETLRSLLGPDLAGTAEVGEWGQFVTMRGEYVSKLGPTRRTLELPINPVVERTAQSPAAGAARVALSVTDFLPTREEWECEFRRIVRRTGGGVCTGTFTEVKLQTLCDELDAAPARRLR